jgi:hypothetical protein
MKDIIAFRPTAAGLADPWSLRSPVWKRFVLTVAVASLLLGPAYAAEDRFVVRAVAAAEEATRTTELAAKLVFVWVNDDGETAPLASVVHAVAVGAGDARLDREERHGGSHFKLRGTAERVDKDRRRLSGSFSVAMKLGEGRKLRDGAVGTGAEFEGMLGGMVLERGKPMPISVSRVSNASGSAEKFDEVNSLVVIWR